MKDYNRNSLKERIRKLVIKYQFEKKLNELLKIKKDISELEILLLFENVRTEWSIAEDLKRIKEIDPNLLPEKDRKLYDILLQGTEIANVYEKILDKLVDIVEREGINKVEKNFPEYFNSAIREVLPKPDDYRSFKKRTWEYLKTINKELLSDSTDPLYWFFESLYEAMEYHEQRAFDHIEKEIQEIYGEDKINNLKEK